MTHKAGTCLAVAVLSIVISCTPQEKNADSSKPVSSSLARGLGKGSVQTIAGPGYCGGQGALDAKSTAVGGVAADATGFVYFLTGPSDDARLGKVDPKGNAELVDVPDLRRAQGPKSRSSEKPTLTGVRMAADGSGGVILALRETLMRIEPSGAYHALAGPFGPSPQRSVASGDGGLATEARFAGIRSIASDERGNVFVADREGRADASFRIRFINRSSEPVTFWAGTHSEKIVDPSHIDTILGPVRGTRPSMAATGIRLYLASPDTGKGRSSVTIRVVNVGGEAISAHGFRVEPSPSGIVVAGGRGARRDARLNSISSVSGAAADGRGNLYLADPDNHRVVKLDAEGRPKRFAGASRDRGGFNGNNIPAAGALLNQPSDVAIASSGALYISDEKNGQIRLVDGAGIIRAGPGTNLGMRWQCRGGSRQGSVGPLSGSPSGVAADKSGNIYVATATFPGVHRVRLDGKVESFPKNGSRRFVSVAVSEEALYGLDTFGYLHLINTGRNPIRVHGTEIASGGSKPLARESTDRRAGPIPVAPGPLQEGSIDVDSKGSLFAVNFQDREIVQVTERGAVQSILSFKGGSKCCPLPVALTLDPLSNLYVSNTFPPQVWYFNRGSSPINVHGRVVAPGAAEVIAGSGSPGFGGDGGPALEAQMRRPAGLAVDRQGNLYVSDAGEHSIRRVDRAGLITTAVGTGSPGFNGDGYKGPFTLLESPAEIALDSCGNLLIADRGNDRIRRINTETTCRP